MRNYKKWFVIVLLFFFSFFLRLWNLNDAGRTWDEPEYVEQGYKMVELLKDGEFDDPFFYTTYDHPPLVKYLYGLTAHLDAVGENPDGSPVLRYDLTYSRLLSAIISSLAVVLVVLFGWQYLSKFVGVTAGVTLAMLPFFLGLSQLVTTESFLILIFTGCVYVYVLLLEQFSWRKVAVAGILSGVALQVKQSNALLFPMLLGMYILWNLYGKKRIQKMLFIQLFTSIIAISVAVFFLIWPIGLIHLPEVYAKHSSLWNIRLSPNPLQITVSVPEVFFGRLMLTPIVYYIVYFFITTPLLVLLLFFTGVFYTIKLKKWHLAILLLWFVIPFLLSVYAWRQHGVRYIIQIYAPLVLLTAFGLEMVMKRFQVTQSKKYFYILPLILYLFVSLKSITPYYIDYFNGLVGGTTTVYEKRSFQIGWWGEGIGEAGRYVKTHVPSGSSIGLALSPAIVFPHLPEYNVETYRSGKTYDYVVVNFYNILREGFDDTEIKKHYQPVYNIYADGAILATVYKRK